ncbi:ABC transporter substrate-binding protein, partial [Bordetella pertussis]|uniref:ABC transporter substrate-binding protein n=1 Tax=Bordetella pertussis TaxID=520 RepID=UPI000B02537A
EYNLLTVHSYPWQFIETPEHQAFLKAYQAKFKDYPRLGSVVGYSAIKSLAEGIKRAGGKTDTESMIKAFAGLKLTIPFGPIEYRTLDNQSTMGAYVGKLASKDGKGVMVDFRYVDGAAAQPSDEEVRKLRKAD